MAMARILVRKWKLSAGLAASLAAGGTVAYCESDKRGPLFDPEALERGAKALKEINASPYAKKVIRDTFEDVLVLYFVLLSSPAHQERSTWDKQLLFELSNVFKAEWLPATFYSSTLSCCCLHILAVQVFDLTKQQEITKAQELKTEEAKHLALQSQHATVSLQALPLSRALKDCIQSHSRVLRNSHTKDRLNFLLKNAGGGKGAMGGAAQVNATGCANKSRVGKI